jgi:hypothetical protein
MLVSQTVGVSQPGVTDVQADECTDGRRERMTQALSRTQDSALRIDLGWCDRIHRQLEMSDEKVSWTLRPRIAHFRFGDGSIVEKRLRNLSVGSKMDWHIGTRPKPSIVFYSDVDAPGNDQ